MLEDESLGFLLVEMTRMFRAEFDNNIKNKGFALTAGEARALARIDRSQPLRQNLLANLLGLDSMTVSQYLDRLENKGLVTRSPDPNDRRAKLVATTQAATPYLETIRNIGSEIDGRIAAAFSSPEWAEFKQDLEKAYNGLKDLRHNNSQP